MCHDNEWDEICRSIWGVQKYRIESHSWCDSLRLGFDKETNLLMPYLVLKSSYALKLLVDQQSLFFQKKKDWPSGFARPACSTFLHHVF
jgi:hypothetical protein